MNGVEEAIEAAVSDPDLVMRDAVRKNCENYYRRLVLPPPLAESYVKVCVRFHDEPGEGRIGIVATAYPTDTIKSGEKRRWARRKR
jgi:hypothetical protein